MNPGKQLHELQEIDLELAKKSDMLLQLEKQLARNEALENTKGELRSREEQLTEMGRRLKEREWALDDLLAKAKPLRVKLYGGSVINPKEVANLEQQVGQLNGQIKGEEDAALDLMTQTESTRGEIAALAGRLKTMEAEWQEKQAALTAEQASLVSAMDTTRKKRETVAAGLDPARLQLYEAIRAKKLGYAVARVEQGRCQGCRITLSTSEIAKARVGELIQCNSCSRILYVG